MTDVNQSVAHLDFSHLEGLISALLQKQSKEVDAKQVEHLVSAEVANAKSGKKLKKKGEGVFSRASSKKGAAVQEERVDLIGELKDLLKSGDLTAQERDNLEELLSTTPDGQTVLEELLDGCASAYKSEVAKFGDAYVQDQLKDLPKDSSVGKLYSELAETDDSGKTLFSRFSDEHLSNRLGRGNSVPEDTLTVPEDTLTVPEDTLTVPEDTLTVPEDTLTGPSTGGDNPQFDPNSGVWLVSIASRIQNMMSEELISLALMLIMLGAETVNSLIKSANAMAQGIAQLTIDQGNKQADQYLSTGITSMISGAVSIGAVMYSTRSTQENLREMKGYRNKEIQNEEIHNSLFGEGHAEGIAQAEADGPVVAATEEKAKAEELAADLEDKYKAKLKAPVNGRDGMTRQEQLNQERDPARRERLRDSIREDSIRDFLGEHGNELTGAGRTKVAQEFFKKLGASSEGAFKNQGAFLRSLNTEGRGSLPSERDSFIQHLRTRNPGVTGPKGENFQDYAKGVVESDKDYLRGNADRAFSHWNTKMQIVNSFVQAGTSVAQGAAQFSNSFLERARAQAEATKSFEQQLVGMVSGGISPQQQQQVNSLKLIQDFLEQNRNQVQAAAQVAQSGRA